MGNRHIKEFNETKQWFKQCTKKYLTQQVVIILVPYTKRSCPLQIFFRSFAIKTRITSRNEPVPWTHWPRPSTVPMFMARTKNASKVWSVWTTRWTLVRLAKCRCFMISTSKSTWLEWKTSDQPTHRSKLLVTSTPMKTLHWHIYINIMVFCKHNNLCDDLAQDFPKLLQYKLVTLAHTVRKINKLLNYLNKYDNKTYFFLKWVHIYF